jgi:hypothetical protein
VKGEPTALQPSLRPDIGRTRLVALFNDHSGEIIMDHKGEEHEKEK